MAFYKHSFAWPLYAFILVFLPFGPVLGQQSSDPVNAECAEETRYLSCWSSSIDPSNGTMEVHFGAQEEPLDVVEVSVEVEGVTLDSIDPASVPSGFVTDVNNNRAILQADDSSSFTIQPGQSYKLLLHASFPGSSGTICLTNMIMGQVGEDHFDSAFERCWDYAGKELGCTDSTAFNYDPNAVGSDGSCWYGADLSIVNVDPANGSFDVMLNNSDAIDAFSIVFDGIEGPISVTGGRAVKSGMTFSTHKTAITGEGGTISSGQGVMLHVLADMSDASQVCMDRMVLYANGNTYERRVKVCQGIPKLSDVTGVSINVDNAPPDSSAMLDVSASHKGVLLPRLNTSQRNGIQDPAESLMLYDAAEQGFYFYDTTWSRLAARKNVWGISGNAGIDTTEDFLGTRTPQPLLIKTDGMERMRAGASGGLFFKERGHFQDRVRVDSTAYLDHRMEVQGRSFMYDRLLIDRSSGTNLKLRNGSDGNALLVPQGQGLTGLGTTSPTSRLHVKDTTGYEQFRMEVPYTPNGPSDNKGKTGTMTWDKNYIYIKTPEGWKRATLKDIPKGGSQKGGATPGGGP